MSEWIRIHERYMKPVAIMAIDPMIWNIVIACVWLRYVAANDPNTFSRDYLVA